MLPYRVKYTEYESDIKNNNFLYKLKQIYQNTFDCWGKFSNKEKQITLFYFIISINSIIRIL